MRASGHDFDGIADAIDTRGDANDFFQPSPTRDATIGFDRAGALSTGGDAQGTADGPGITIAPGAGSVPGFAPAREGKRR
jgi:hypothetical protein